MASWAPVVSSDLASAEQRGDGEVMTATTSDVHQEVETIRSDKEFEEVTYDISTTLPAQPIGGQLPVHPPLASSSSSSTLPNASSGFPFPSSGTPWFGTSEGQYTQSSRQFVSPQATGSPSASLQTSTLPAKFSQHFSQGVPQLSGQASLQPEHLHHRHQGHHPAQLQRAVSSSSHAVGGIGKDVSRFGFSSGAGQGGRARDRSTCGH